MTEDIVELVKQRNPIEEVIEAEDGFSLDKRGGRYRKCREHDSLVVDVHVQAYHWNSRGEHGDVINWVMARSGADFKGAVELLCRRANLPDPDWGEKDNVQRITARARVDVFSVAADIFASWLWRSNTAQAYARGRGWTDDTIKAASLGYTGSRRQREALINELKSKMIESGIDPESPASVALLGYTGNVKAWARKHGVDPHDNWTRDNQVPSLVGMGMLVYPHIQGGRVRYFSARSIEGKIHYNLPVVLAGPRQPYYNVRWSPTEKECVVVEGQADAVTLLQWGMASVALAGVEPDKGFTEMLARHEKVYLGMDADKAGNSATAKLAKPLGPMVRLVQWPKRSEGDKDANDLLKSMVAEDLQVKDQTRIVRDLFAQARTYVERIAEWAGEQEGSALDEAQRKALEVIALMNPVTLAQYRARLSKALGLNLRDFGHILKTVTKENGFHEDEDKGPDDIVELVGGYIEDHLIELLYDPAAGITKFAVRYPDGHMGVTERIDLNKTRYIPIWPNMVLQKNAVLMPSALPVLRSVTELVAVIRQFIHRYVDIDEFYERLASYYVLFTWLYDCFQVIPYLRALGDYGTGKTRLIQVVGAICYRPIFTAGASTVSPIFRMMDKYKGTLIMDEADFARSDESADIIKIFNTGYMKGTPLLRSAEKNGAFDVEVYEVFGPKIIATRKKFFDKATESRCLTKEMGGGVPRADIPLVLPRDFWHQATQIRNLLLAYRMKNWVPEADVNYNNIDRSIEPRLNQVTMALKTIIQDDPELLKQIDEFIREYNRQLVVERSMTLGSKVLEALVKMHEEENKVLFPSKETDEEGNRVYYLKNLTRKVNELINTENREEGDDEDDDENNSSRKRLGPKRIGAIVRNELQLPTNRATSGENKGNYYVVWSDERIQALCYRFGIGFVKPKNEDEDVENPDQEASE